MLIRAATAADRDAVAALHLASWRDGYGVVLSAEVLRDVLPGYMRDTWAARTFAPPELTLVAEADGTLAGFVCTLTDRDPPYVDNLHVRPDLRGSGIGARLVEATKDALRQRGATRMCLTVLELNPRARAFYLANGGVDEGGREDILVGHPVRSRMIAFDLTR